MASTLKVDNIIATDGTTAPITLSGDAATLGSAVTFPAGHVLQVVTTVDNTEIGVTTGQTPYNYSQLNTTIKTRNRHRVCSKDTLEFVVRTKDE